jgi:DNA-directed RNA polymerase subunit RPC12/RpoP
MPIVHCPDCGALIDLPEDVKSGQLVECPNCAGHALRVHKEAAGWAASLAYRVSCPSCDEVITLPESVKPGDTIRCCGRRWRLTFAYGGFAAEAV